MRMVLPVLVGAVATFSAHAEDCGKSQILWLRAKGFTLAEIMAWCDAPATQQTQILTPGQAATDFVSRVPRPTEEAFKAEATRRGVTVERVKAERETVIVAEQTRQVATLSDFSTKKSNGSQLVTGHIATAYAPARLTLGEKPEWYNFIAMDISASIPVESATLKDYGKQALFTPDGGVLNILLSKGRPSYNRQDSTLPNFDHYYIADPDDPQVYAGQLLVYSKAGFGGRAIKTALTGNGYAGLATAYAGFGVDGPLLGNWDIMKKDAKAGWASLEFFAMANAANKETYNKLFGAKPTRVGVYSWGANLGISLPGKFYLTLGYARGLGDYGRTKIGGMSVFSFGYNGGPEAKKKEQEKPST